MPAHFDEDSVRCGESCYGSMTSRPHIYRTRDGGRTWTAIDTGHPDDAPVNAVREDPIAAGLLYAGTETASLRLLRRR